MTTAYLALGSNIGDRLDNLRQACVRLGKSSELQIEARSRIYETQSVEGGGPDDFLNACVRVQTSLSPMQLLHCIRHIEYAMGRPQPPRHGPRLIDIDILLFGEETIDTPELQVPHPRMVRRAFVLRPLSDVLEGGWVNEYSAQWEQG
ncbi:MAG TPA: 2-amino-4-hydroxy-6-hydroxymethyldihydropteridine diphosphokinase [Abditibacteriaceae bacterium]|jgi:2-amino-4-hydroxy-6-hydroxymethyldihydropteridine diphosphokinase